ncbi:hypothetical protein J7337_004992 [Fusarium musae]|uniref:C2H2-type domain-containing protein n=1 Tax=Fusarium musae TaxID=1042133 RepID=A0A9P8DI27_9HYPO|nr:hypothetical protein J7337_004992 [Fusarium musae]KAG9502167.1 hypothetical protein J7337_004992 [Fusarium musae]
MDSKHERMPIAHNVRNVLNSFQTVATSLNQEIDSLDEKAEFDGLRELPLALENENVRFKMWAGNLGAHQSGPASLDHRLREAPHIQEQVLYLLRDILESLEDIRVLMLRREPLKGSADIEDKLGSPLEGSDPESEDRFTDSDLDGDENTPETRLSTLCTDIAEAIDCLLRLSLAIANPAPHERFRKLGAGPDEDISFYEAHDVRYVQDKFPNISKKLPDILGKFITRRRQFFKYRESHHAKLAEGLDQATHKDTSRTEVVPNTVASSLPEHFKRSGVIDEDNRSDMAMSETSYATSAGYLMLEDGEMRPVPLLKVPQRPPEAEKGDDISQFPRGMEYHWRTWSCPFKCGSTFPSAVELGDHVRNQHLLNASDGHLATVVARGEVSVSNDVTQECPLCKRAISGLKSYIKHVGRHLEQLALHALPKIGCEGLEDDIESGEQNDEASELGAVSAEESSETSSGADEQLETGEIDNQVESSGPHATTVRYNAEGDVTAAGDTTMPPAASTISSDQPVVELAKIGKLEDIPLDIVRTQAGANLEEVGMMTTAEREAAAMEAVERYKRQELARIKAEKARIGMEETEELSIGPSDEVESASQDNRPVYTRMSRRHLSLETLRQYDVNYEFDADPEYVLIRRWVPEWEQDRMWKHTRIIREKRAETLLNETPIRSAEHEYEWVRKKGRRQSKSPPRLYDPRAKPFLCNYDGCEHAAPGNGFPHQWNLQDHMSRVHNDNGNSGDYSSKPGERNQPPPRRPPSIECLKRAHIRTSSRERGAPPSPSPSPPPSQPIIPGPTTEREVITHYRDIDYVASPDRPEEMPAPEPFTFDWEC